MYGVLMKWNEMGIESFQGVDMGSGPEWDGIRQQYKILMDLFIANVKDFFRYDPGSWNFSFSCMSSCLQIATKKR